MTRIEILIILLEILFSLSVGVFSYKRKSISISGLIALLLICGVFISLQQIAYLIILFSMFASSSLLSKFQKAKKIDFENVIAKNGPRDAFQAIANLGTAVLAALLYFNTKDIKFIYAFVASVSASNADSWASEIGGLSEHQPISILNFKPIRKGLSGGITALGTLGGIFGAIFIALISCLTINSNLIADTELFWKSTLIGIFGFMLDSIFGATLQAKYLGENGITEKVTDKKTSGYAVITNDMVNLLTTLMAGILGYLIA